MNTDASGNYAGSFTISVRGGDGSLDALHPQSPGAHWITNVWVEDQDGNVVCQHTFADEAAEAGEGEVVDVEEPTYTCNYEITDASATLTSYEHCNIHGVWQGPTIDIALAVSVAGSMSNSDAFNTVVYPKDPTADPVKHEAAMSAVDGGYSIGVLGTDGEGLHPHEFDTHYIVATWAIDGHGTAVAFTELGDAVDTAQSPAFSFPDGFAGTVSPWEHCNLHGVWEGAAFTVEAATDETDDSGETDDAGSGDDTTDNSTAASTAKLTAMVAVLSALVAALF